MRVFGVGTRERAWSDVFLDTVGSCRITLQRCRRVSYMHMYMCMWTSFNLKFALTFVPPTREQFICPPHELIPHQ